MKTIRFFVLVFWVIALVYLASIFLDMMNVADTFTLTAGVLGMVLITYLSIQTRLGTKYFKSKK